MFKGLYMLYGLVSEWSKEIGLGSIVCKHARVRIPSNPFSSIFYEIEEKVTITSYR